jgi:hypothetical protein
LFGSQFARVPAAAIAAAGHKGDLYHPKPTFAPVPIPASATLQGGTESLTGHGYAQ